MVTLLIENGASLESLAEVYFFFFSFSLINVWFLKDGLDPFIAACELGHLEIVQFLLEKGSSLEPIPVNHLSLFFSGHIFHWMLCCSILFFFLV